MSASVDSDICRLAATAANRRFSSGVAMTLGAYSGEVSADGNTILIANLQAGNAPYVEVDIKQGQTNFTNADFSGIYQVVSITSPGDSSSSLTLTADGAGGYSGNLVQNNAGVITSSAVVVPTVLRPTAR